MEIPTDDRQRRAAFGQMRGAASAAGTQEPVRIAHRDGGDPARALGHEVGAVADPGARPGPSASARSGPAAAPPAASGSDARLSAAPRTAPLPGGPCRGGTPSPGRSRTTPPGWRGPPAATGAAARTSPVCASLAGCAGSSAQPRWLITSRTSMPAYPSASASRATSSGDRPKRDMPVSACSAAGRACPRARARRCHSATWPALFSTGSSPCAANSGAVPGGTPFSTRIDGSGPSRPRSATPSPRWATKKDRQPAAASTGATRATPSP